MTRMERLLQEMLAEQQTDRLPVVPLAQSGMATDTEATTGDALSAAEPLEVTSEENRPASTSSPAAPLSPPLATGERLAVVNEPVAPRDLPLAASQPFATPSPELESAAVPHLDIAGAAAVTRELPPTVEPPAASQTAVPPQLVTPQSATTPAVSQPDAPAAMETPRPRLLESPALPRLDTPAVVAPPVDNSAGLAGGVLPVQLTRLRDVPNGDPFQTPSAVPRSRPEWNTELGGDAGADLQGRLQQFLQAPYEDFPTPTGLDATQQVEDGLRLLEQRNAY